MLFGGWFRQKNMKNALMTSLVLGTFSAGCAATPVEIYGVLDYGMSLVNRHNVDGSHANAAQMMSGQYIGSRFGLKGAEDLGNGLKVGYVLESGIGADTGTLGQNNRLFGRDARLYVEGDFGHIGVGRMGSMVGGNGPYARFGHVINAFSCGWGNVGGSLQVVSLGYEYIDNAIAYVTPKFAGVDATFQYSLGSDTKSYGDNGVEGKSSVERMASGAICYQNDTVLLVGGIETINQAQPAADRAGLEDAFSFNLGGSYNAGWAKFYAYGQYFDSYAKAAKATMFGPTGGVDGYGVNFGIEGKALAGTVKASVGFGDFKGNRARDLTMKTTQTAAGYTYSLSRRTTLYTAAGWIHNDYSVAYEATAEGKAAAEDVYEWLFGIVHKF